MYRVSIHLYCIIHFIDINKLIQALHAYFWKGFLTRGKFNWLWDNRIINGMVTSIWQLHRVHRLQLPGYITNTCLPRLRVSMLLSTAGAAAAATWCRSGDDSLEVTPAGSELNWSRIKVPLSSSGSGSVLVPCALISGFSGPLLSVWSNTITNTCLLHKSFFF